MLDINNIYCGDCFDYFDKIDDKSIDMILSDPPYGTIACDWDVVISMAKFWTHAKRVLKNNGSVVLTACQPFTTQAISSNLPAFKYCWVWIKNRPTLPHHSKNRPMSKYEDICVFSYASMGHKSLLGERRMTYNPQGVSPVVKEKVVTSKGSHSSHTGPRPNQVGRKYEALTGLPNNILYFDKEEDHSHPTQKPVKLFEYLIKTYTNDNELVLDPFAGSCTTAISAVKCNRNFICIEKDEKYWAVGNNRLYKFKEANADKK